LIILKFENFDIVSDLDIRALDFLLVGVLGFEPRSNPPKGLVLPLHYTPFYLADALAKAGLRILSPCYFT
jgi:hypothetical protein